MATTRLKRKSDGGSPSAVKRSKRVAASARGSSPVDQAATDATPIQSLFAGNTTAGTHTNNLPSPAPSPPNTLSAAIAFPLPPATSRPLPILQHTPREVLYEIFRYIADDEATKPSTLLGISQLCRDFHDPALDALYFAPRLNSAVHAFRLIKTLESHPFYNHRVKSLNLPVNPLLAFKTPEHGRFDLCKIIRACHGLRELHITGDNEGAYRSREKEARWHYTPEIFETLNGMLRGKQIQQPRKLRSWRWNGNYFKDMEVADIIFQHKRPALQSVRKLACVDVDEFADFENGRRKKKKKIKTQVDEEDDAFQFGTMLESLPNLKELELVSCDLAHDTFFEMLPQMAPDMRLTSLKLVSLKDVNTGLSDLLRSPLCSELQKLEILHCPAIDLSFLTALECTPDLRTLTLDGQYFSGKDIYSKAQPLFDKLLPDFTHPVWPASLEHITLASLQNGSNAQAETIVSSLIDRQYQHALPHVRSVKLHFILPRVAWRDRAGMRENWVQKFKDAFVQRPGSPGRVMRTTRSGTDSPVRAGGMCEDRNVELKVDGIRPADHPMFSEQDFIDDDTRVRRVVNRASAYTAPIPASSQRVQGRSARPSRTTRAVPKRRRTRTMTPLSDDEDDEDYHD